MSEKPSGGVATGKETPRKAAAGEEATRGAAAGVQITMKTAADEVPGEAEAAVET